MGFLGLFNSESKSATSTAQTDTSQYSDNAAISANVTGANSNFNLNAPAQIWPLLEAVVNGAYSTMGEVVGQVSQRADDQYTAATDLVNQQYNSLGAVQQFVKNIGPLFIVGGAIWLYFRKDKK